MDDPDEETGGMYGGGGGLLRESSSFVGSPRGEVEAGWCFLVSVTLGAICSMSVDVVGNDGDNVDSAGDMAGDI